MPPEAAAAIGAALRPDDAPVDADPDYDGPEQQADQEFAPCARPWAGAADERRGDGVVDGRHEASGLGDGASRTLACVHAHDDRAALAVDRVSRVGDVRVSTRVE